MTNQEFIRQQIGEVRTMIDVVEGKFLPLDHDTLNWKETAERWSILECFEHLNRYNRYYNPALQNATRKMQARSGGKSYSSRWMGRLFINMMNPKNTKKQKTLKHLNPVGSNLDGGVLKEFISLQRSLITIIERAGHINLNKQAVPVEFFRLLKLSVGDAILFVVTHEKRHLVQAENVLQKQNFQRVDLIV